MSQQSAIDEIWRQFLSDGDLHKNRHWLGRLPGNPRCKLCHTPLGGLSGPLMRLVLGRRPSKKNPYFCNVCDQFSLTHPGGAEIELTMLFVDVRGSTTLAESMSPSAFSQLMKLFYAAATEVLVKTDAMIDKLVGDEVIGLYLPGYTGPRHARLAVQAAQDLLSVTSRRESIGLCLPVGVGVHTGNAYVGTVQGTEGTVTDVTALGDNVNITARLASAAGPGEALISETAYSAAGLNLGNLEQRQLKLKGKSEPVGVRVVRIAVG